MNHIETYSRQDFPNDKCNTAALENEIKTNESLVIKYLHIDTYGNGVYINFNDGLTTSEKNQLDLIVSNHNTKFGIIIEPPIIETPIFELVDDISFSTPRPTPLPSINEVYSNIVVLGQNGPDLSNLDKLTFNWDLGNTQLNSFNFNTINGQPGWWVNLIPLISQNFSSPNPDLTLVGSGVDNLDGEYWVNYYESGIALVSKSGSFSIYASKITVDVDYLPRNYSDKFLIINPYTYKIFASPNNFNVYGSEYNFVKSYDEQTTSSNNYQTALTLNVTDLPNGNYKIIASHRYGITVTNNQYYSRLLLNGNQLGNEFIVRENRNVNRKFNQFMFIETLKGDVTIDLQYRRGNGNAYISDMIIEMFKVN